MRALEILLAVLTALLLVPVSVLCLQVLAALAPWRRRPLAGSPRPRLAVLMPAHDEAGGIGESLQALLPQLAEGDRLLVVADNCSDGTAAIAAAGGAEVIERHDPARRGKGYALDFGVRHLAAAPPEVLLVVDADCRVEAGAVDRLARLCGATKRPVQALYLMHSPAGAGLKSRIAEFAWLVKNKVRPLGYRRLGLPCQLMGSGMAFPWPLIAEAALASGHIVEDLKLGMDLARHGTPPLFCPDALVSSTFPASREGLASQRTRWEHGHLGMLVAEGPRFLIAALGGGNLPLLALALDLFVPPLALLALFLLVAVALAGGFLALGGGALPFLLAASALALFTLAVLLAWWRHGRAAISLFSLAYAPFYALWKIPLYLRFLSHRQMEWIRSQRDK